jgi:hypothetical protein
MLVASSIAVSGALEANSMSRAETTLCASHVKRTASSQLFQKLFMSSSSQRRGPKARQWHRRSIGTMSRKLSKFDARDSLKLQRTR